MYTGSFSSGWSGGGGGGGGGGLIANKNAVLSSSSQSSGSGSGQAQGQNTATVPATITTPYGNIMAPPEPIKAENPLSKLAGGLSRVYQGGKEFVSDVVNSPLPVIGNTDFGETMHNLIRGDQSYPGAEFIQNKNLPEGSYTPEFAGLPGYNKFGAAAPKKGLTLGDIGFGARQLAGDPIAQMQRVENTMFPEGGYATAEPAPGELGRGTFGGTEQLFAKSQATNYPLRENEAAMEQGYATVLDKIKTGQPLTGDEQWASGLIEEQLAEQGLTLADIQPQPQPQPLIAPPEPIPTAEEVGKAWTQRRNPLRGLGGIYG